MKTTSLILLVLFSIFVYSNQEHTSIDLIHDLEILKKSQSTDPKPFPVYYSDYLYTGYFAMPTATLPKAGTLAIGYTKTPPYLNYNIAFQLFQRLELSGSYRIFQGVSDQTLSQYGFGDYADKGVNFKFSVIQPEDSNYQLPGFVIGSVDFLGSRNFTSYYLTLTKIFNTYHTECSLGYGWKRIKGLFGGINILPFRTFHNPYVNNISLNAEYDATDYKNDPSPYGRTRKSPVNWGAKYRLFNTLDLTINRLRGEETSLGFNIHYNLGKTKGMLSKHKNLPLYHAPVNTHPLGVIRPSELMIQYLAYTLREQGFELIEGRIGNATLTLFLINNKWLQERTVYRRLIHILASLAPANIETINVLISQFGTPIQQYTFRTSYLTQYHRLQINSFELSVLSPLKNAPSSFSPKKGTLIYKQNSPWYKLLYRPTLASYFGNAAGKYKYAFGASAGIEGTFANTLYYKLDFNLPIKNNLSNLNTVDRLNPSQVINVRSDLIAYKKNHHLSLSQGFIQKNWNLGNNWFARLSGGYFEYAYGGAAGELLYYPINLPWAIGIDAAWLRKRNYSGLGFTSKVRKLQGFTPTYIPFHPWQLFLTTYLYSPTFHMEYSAKFGRFLAKDLGVKLSAGKYFSSGLKVSFWITLTNANDRVNRRTYFDQGISLSIPLDWFRPTSSRRRFSYSMAAWLRDSGASSNTGIPLYEMISSERFNY